ncbi:MAG TPA: tripartite tricarboxylate transporter substrate-binding protein [Pseudolabrys sp.]|jgi:tripartite-type tricarboxylate transporter receptor subunit TctC
MKLVLLGAALAAPLMIGGLTPVQAQSYPTHNITMIVPFPAGGPSDIVARIAADGMSKNLGTSVIIENVGGAGGTVGASRAAEAKGDGYTLFAASMGTIIAAPSFYPNLRYDSNTDFEPIGMSANAPAAVSVRKDIPAKNLKEFVAWAKQNGEGVKQAHGGVGGTSHMACLLFNNIVGIKPTMVAYRGMGPGMNDLMGGHIDIACEQAIVMVSAINGEKVTGVVVAGPNRLAAIPQVPTAQEAGIPDFQLNIWSGIYAPKGTPKDVIAKLADALDKTLDDPVTSERLGKLGGTVPPKAERGPDFLRKTVASDIPRWAPILKEAAATTAAPN